MSIILLIIRTLIQYWRIKNMNPFDANERHRYIIESGGNPVSSADGKEKEIWVNSINPLVELK